MLKKNMPSSSWFLKLTFFLLNDGTVVPKYVGDTPLTRVLISTVYLVGVVNDDDKTRRTFEKTVLRRIFEPNREEVTGSRVENVA